MLSTVSSEMKQKIRTIVRYGNNKHSKSNQLTNEPLLWCSHPNEHKKVLRGFVPLDYIFECQPIDAMILVVNSLIGNYVLAGRKIVLFDRYIRDLYVGIVK